MENAKLKPLSAETAQKDSVKVRTMISMQLSAMKACLKLRPRSRPRSRPLRIRFVTLHLLAAKVARAPNSQSMDNHSSANGLQLLQLLDTAVYNKKFWMAFYLGNPAIWLAQSLPLMSLNQRMNLRALQPKLTSLCSTRASNACQTISTSVCSETLTIKKKI
jgi:hypothetical protein